MDKTAVTLQVLYSDPFWVGIVERVSDGVMKVSKITFGPEPKDYEVYAFILEHYHRLKFSPAVEYAAKERRMNPKRIQKEARKMIQNAGIGTKSQQALKLQHEAVKTERRIRSKAEKEEEKERMFELKQQKRKEKHRGR